MQASAFSSLMLILFSTSHPGSRLKTHESTEMVAFIVKTAGGDIPTICTVIKPPRPRLMGHKKQNQTQTPLHHGVTQAQLRENKPAQPCAVPTSHQGTDQLQWKAQHSSWQRAPLGEAPNTQLKLHCFIQLTRAVPFFFFSFLFAKSIKIHC